MDNQEAWDLEITFHEANGENESEVEETDFANVADSHSENDRRDNWQPEVSSLPFSDEGFRANWVMWP